MHFERGNIRHLFPAFRDGKCERTIAKTQLVMQDKDISVSAALFFKDIDPGNAKIDTALPDADYNISRALKDDAQLRDCRDLSLILTRVGLEDAQSRCRKKIERVDFKATFGWE